MSQVQSDLSNRGLAFSPGDLVELRIQILTYEVVENGSEWSPKLFPQFEFPSGTRGLYAGGGQHERGAFAVLTIPFGDYATKEVAVPQGVLSEASWKNNAPDSGLLLSLCDVVELTESVKSAFGVTFDRGTKALYLEDGASGFAFFLVEYGRFSTKSAVIPTDLLRRVE